MRKALFFLRHYNDIDHIVPVIHKWSQTGHTATVILLGFSDIRNDYRIRYITGLDGIRVLPLAALLSRFDLFRFRLLSLLLYARAGYARSGTVFDLLCRAWPESARRRLWSRTAGRILDAAFGTDPDGVVVFDWISTNSTLPLEFVREALSCAHDRGYTGVSLPHGDSPHINELIRIHELQIEPQSKYAQSEIFDNVVVPNELCAKRYRPYLEGARIRILGSARYSDEWLEVLTGLLPPAAPARTPGELGVVMFLRKKEFSLFWDEIERVIVMIGQLHGVRLIIKPHTRDFRQQPLKSILRRTRSPQIGVAGDDTHSASLLAWADVVIDVATSVSFEAIKRGIPVLAAEYLHAGYSALAHYVPETAMHYRDEIYNALIALRENPKRPFYDEEHRRTFIRTMLDVPDERVLDRYVALLEGRPVGRETQSTVQTAP